MSLFGRHRSLAATMLGGALFVIAGNAVAAPPDTSTSDTTEANNTRTANYLDLIGSVGFSSNPRLNFNSSSSAFGRISASGVHSWSTERSQTSITGYVENTSYFKNYGSQQIFDVGANTSYTASPTVSLYGNVNFSGDINGQLSNRLFTVPSGPPPPPNPGNPFPPTTATPDVLAFNGHNYRLIGQGGANIATSERSSISLTAGAQHSWFTRNSNANYTGYFGSIGYSHLLSERTSIGPTLYLHRQDYANGGWANVINPTLTAHTQFSETWTADAAVGVLYIKQKNLGFTSDNWSPSFSGAVCDTTTLSRFCLRVTHDASSAFDTRIANLGTHSTIHSTAYLDYSRQLGPYGTIQAQLSATRYSNAPAFNGSSQTTTYFSGVLGYDRRVGHRLAVGISGGARKLYEFGPDPKADFNANVYLRYRIGDIQ